MSAVEILRENDPTRTCIWIRLQGEPSDAALAQALDQNPFVTEIVIVLDVVGLQRADWDSLLRVIATRVNLGKVELHQGLDVLMDLQDGVDGRTATAGLVRAFLHAIQQNASIRSVQLYSIRLPTNVSTFVNTASSITLFTIFDCDMEATERDSGARDLAAVLQCNTNIKTLTLSNLEDIYTILILEGLESNVSLKTFIFSPISTPNISDATSHALQHLLESTTSILRFTYCSASFSDERLFHPIAQAITNSECVSELTFSRANFRFEGRNSLAPLQSILLNKFNLTSLCLNECNFVGGQVHEDIISIVSRPNSPLRSLEFQSDDNFLGEGLSRILFENLLRAIEKSKLERFQIGSIEAPEFLQALTQSIPSMKLKELEVKFWDSGDSDDEDEPEGGFDQDAIRQDLLHAVQNNFSLRSVKVRIHDYQEFDLFESTEDKHRLAFYANRNARLDQWVGHPEIVEQRKVWPNALGLAEKSGPDALFCGLRSVLESDYGSLRSGRKRKRPQYYTPA